MSLHLKDGRYALAAGEALDAWTPITRLTHDLFTEAAVAGHRIHSAAAVAQVYELRTGSTFVNDATTEAGCCVRAHGAWELTAVY